MRFFLLVCLVPLVASKAANRSPCNPNEVDCGENGCFPMYYEGTNGSHCLQTCPISCGPEEQVCNGGTGMSYDTNCMPSAYDYCYPLTAGECQQHCPVTCGENEMVCSSFDPYTFCPNPDYCTPATYEGNNGFACSTSCPVTCNVGEMYCPGVQDPVTGCMGTDICIPEMVGMCPSFCPVTCGPEETMCPGMFDETTGCEMDPGYCVPVGTEC